jgi:Ca2+-binding EF-hand superfamily protein
MRMRNIGIISFAVLGLAGSASVAQAQSREDNFRAWDTNHDGLLEIGEMQQNQANFRAMDCNKDGYLTMYEFVNRYECNGDQSVATPAPRPQAVPVPRSVPRATNRSIDRNAAAQSRFDSLDRNRDGVVSRAEWRGESAAFADVDRNRDNVVTRDEYMGLYDGAYGNNGTYDNRGTARGTANGRDRQFRDLDRNNDGVLSRSEWRGQGTSFRDADRNGDGVISRDEYYNLYGSNGTYDGPYDTANGGYGPDGSYGGYGAGRSASYDPRDQRFAGDDRNRDRRLSRSEWQGEPRAFDILDANRDGYISIEEYRDRSALADKFRSWDANRDGVLARDELRVDRSLFDRLDTDRDGVISRDEFLSM